MVTQGIEVPAPAPLCAKVLRPAARAASLPAVGLAPSLEIARAYSVRSRSSLSPTDSPSHGSVVSQGCSDSDQMTDCGRGSRAMGSVMELSWDGSLERDLHQFAMGRAAETDKTGTDEKQGRHRRDAGRRATGRGPGRLRPTGAPHAALRPPVDAVASSRPPWIGGPCPVASAVADEHVRGVPDRKIGRAHV